MNHVNNFFVALMFCVLMTCGCAIDSQPFRSQLGSGFFETLFAAFMVVASYTPPNLFCIAILAAFVGEELTSDDGSKKDRRLRAMWRRAFIRGMVVFVGALVAGGYMDLDKITNATQVDYLKLMAATTLAGFGFGSDRERLREILNGK